ncbi:MAG: aminopeptidase P family protein [Magnetococcales bacterium]|nr:aminopeptidase P family protein [Magnetococcales bacterium]
MTDENARLIYADSERSADMLYATGLFAPDPYLFLQQADGRTHIVTSALEIDRTRRVATVDEVHDWDDIRKSFDGDRNGKSAAQSTLIAHFLNEKGVESVQVPQDFPLDLGDRLRRLGISLAAKKGTFWPQRALKSAQEVAHIEEALRITGQGMMAGITMISASTIAADGMLHLDGAVLTSERVRAEINATLIRAGALPAHTIVAGGEQASDPHEVGHGPLRAHWPVILDVFPRVEKSGYFGDMTRTVVRGNPSERVRVAWETVKKAQERAFERVRPGASGKEIHQELTDLMTEAGYPTGPTKDGRQGGFFHGTGHGLGLEIHEAPRISRVDQTLKEGHVVTVEPGLYYPDMGGVRLEDVVVITRDGCRNLTDVPKFFVVP